MQTQTTTQNTTLLEWQAPSRSEHQRSEKWYVAGGIFCALMVCYGILSGSWSLALVFGFIPGPYYLSRNHAHRIHTLRIQTLGIEFDGKLSPWGDFHEFWILSADGYYELHIAFVKRTRAEIVIQTGSADPFEVRDVLSQFLTQSANRREKLLDAIIRLTKI